MICKVCGYNHREQPQESEKAHTAMVCDIQLALTFQWMDPFQGIEHPKTGKHSRMKMFGWWEKVMEGKVRVYNNVYIHIFNHAAESERFANRFRKAG